MTAPAPYKEFEMFGRKRKPEFDYTAADDAMPGEVVSTTWGNPVTYTGAPMRWTPEPGSATADAMAEIAALSRPRDAWSNDSDRTTRKEA